MHQDLVEHRRWISEKRFLHALNYCMLLPGPEAQQLATYIGWLMHKTWGGIIAGGLFVLPSFFILVGLSWVYLKFGNQPLIAGLFYGIKPAVIAIVIFAAYRIGSRALKNPALWSISAISFALTFIFNTPFPYLVFGAALIGFIGGKLLPNKFNTANQHKSDDKNYGAAWIDDHTPAPEHARFSWAKFSRCIIFGVLLWISAMVLLIAIYGWDSVLAQMAWFFTKAALLTFGGAYAVLPYVFQGAVEHHHWLSAAQMIDGLALGETTPGPLIMIVTFVGFVGGWSKELFGPDSLFLAGLIAASVTTIFTFLPSFLFVLIGAPLIESTHGNLKITAPLTSITAAVVGVILNLAVFFAHHVLWPHGFTGKFELFSLLLSLAAGAALFRFKLGIIPIIISCGVIGAAYAIWIK